MKEFVLSVLLVYALTTLVSAQEIRVDGRGVSPQELSRISRSGQITSWEDINKSIYRNEKRLNTAKKQIAPSAADETQHKNFLKQPNTGIIRLVFPKECAMSREKMLKNIDRFAQECPTTYLRGGGSNFSFRKNDYSFSHQADITINKNVIFSMGVFSQGIMVRLGDVPLENISLQSEGVKILADFTPAVTAEEADKQTLQFMNGLQKGNYNYAKGFKVTENTTFALRVVAYRGDLSQDVEWSPQDVKRVRDDLSKMDETARTSSLNITTKSDPLFGDERKDVIVAFRIIKVEPDGSVTLLWRELQRKDSPKMSLQE